MDSFIVVNPNSISNSSEWYLVVPYQEWLNSEGTQLPTANRRFVNYEDALRRRDNLNKELANEH